MLSISIFLVVCIWTYLVTIELLLREGFSLNITATALYDYLVVGNQLMLILSMFFGVYGSIAWGILLVINFFAKMYRLDRRDSFFSDFE